MFDFFYNLIIFGGLPLLFILLFLEGNIISGSFIPGQMLAVFFGFLVSTLDLYPIYVVLLVVFLGSFFGDLFGFYLGFNYGEKTLKIFKISKTSGIYSSSKKFFDKMGFFSIILGRQFNLTRAFIPFLAGSCKISWKKFIFISFISNILWSYMSVFLGFYFGLIILDKISFFLSLSFFLILYFLVLFLFYRYFQKWSAKKLVIIEKYALYNILMASFSFFLFLLFLFLSLTNFPSFFNSYFLFLPSFSYLGVIEKFFSLKFLLVGFSFLFLFTIIFKNLKLFLLFIWGSLISFFITLFLGFFIAGFFSVKIYFSIIFTIVLMFFFWILLNEKTQKSFNLFIFNLLIVTFLLFFIFLKFLIKGDIYVLFLSFFIGIFICELLILFSHFKIFPKNISIKFRF